jgi:hypothetical protein
MPACPASYYRQHLNDIFSFSIFMFFILRMELKGLLRGSDQFPASELI